MVAEGTRGTRTNMAAAGPAAGETTTATLEGRAEEAAAVEEGGGTGGGRAGGGKPGSNVQYQRQLPKFLQAHAHLLNQEGFQEDAKNAWEDYAHSDQLAKYWDEDDVEGNARKGLGSGAVNHKALGLSNDAEEKEQLAKE